MNNHQDANNLMQLGLIAASAVLLLSFYVIGYPLFQALDFTSPAIEKYIRIYITKVGGVIKLDYIFKGIILYFVFLFLYGNKARHIELKYNLNTYLKLGALFAVLFALSNVIILIPFGHAAVAFLYIAFSLLCFYLMCRNLFVYIAMVKQQNLLKNRFNEDEEDFEQVDEKIGDDLYSIYIPALTLNRSAIRKRKRIYWNIVNPFAGTSVTGNPGTGKSYVFINEYIRQCLLNGFTTCIYDYKLGELTNMTYRYLMMNSKSIMNHPNFKGKVLPKFVAFDIDDPMRSVQLNPFSPDNLQDEEDCKDIGYVFMENLNRTWATKQGEFFPESAKNYFTACITFLRYTCLESKSDIIGNCSSFPHVISFINSKAGREKMFTVLANHPKTRIISSAFKDALDDGAMEQLSGQTATVKMAVSSMATPKIYWAFSDNEASCYISNPEDPYYLCLVNNEQKAQSYTPCLSLVLGQVVKRINRPNNLPSLLAIDELATVYVKDIDKLISTARSNKVAVLLGFQDFTQLVKDYKKEIADVVINVCGNVITGRVVRETAKAFQDMFGKIKQKRLSVSRSSSGTSTSTSTQLDYVIPEAKVASLSQGEFALKLSDTVQHKLPIKFSIGEADIDSLGDLRLEHPNNEKYQKLERPIIKETRFKDSSGNLNIEKVQQENYQRIMRETEALIEQEYLKVMSGYYDDEF